MIVYLLLNGICKETTAVSLDLEKCVPSVGTYAEGTVDPSLWYKVLVLDSILVDCDRRTVFWSVDKCDVDIGKDGPDDGIEIEKIRTFFKDKEQKFHQNNCDELDPALEEIFETAENIFHNLYSEIFNEEDNAPIFQDLMKILHIFILPYIELQQNHREVVQDVLSAIEEEHRSIENLIKMNVRKMKNIEELLQKKRRDLLTEDGVSIILNKRPGDEDFIKSFLKHTEKDVRRLDETLSMLSDKVTALRNANDETGVSKLADTRDERDKVSMEKQRIMQTREELVNGISRQKHKKARNMPRKGVKSQSIGADRIGDFEMYKTKSVEVENLNNEIKQKINIKIRLFSVREATRLTLKDIQKHGSSYGYNRNKGSLEIGTELFDPTKKPTDWTALDEHVKACVYASKSDLKTRHYEFCMLFKENCRAMQERDGSVSKEDCETLCKQISDHILRMTDEIATQVRSNDNNQRTLRSKVYKCYEVIISGELMPVLCTLFEQSYRVQCHQLSTWIELYAETELDSINRTLNTLFPSSIESLVDIFSETSSSLSESFDRALSYLFRNEGACSDQSQQAISQNSRFMSAFEIFYATIQEEDTAMSIFSKLRHLTRAVKTAEKTFSGLRARNGQNSIMCTDDILDILILLLCRLGPNRLLKLYAHSNLILHLSPYFLQGSINEYSLVTLTAAFQHLFERQEMHETSVTENSATEDSATANSATEDSVTKTYVLYRRC